MLFWKIPGSNTSKNSIFMAIYLLSHKQSKLDKEDMWIWVEKHEWTHKDSSLIDSCTWMHQCWLTIKDLHQIRTDTRCSMENLPEVMDYRDGWQNRVFFKPKKVSFFWFIQYYSCCVEVQNMLIILPCREVRYPSPNSW